MNEIVDRLPSMNVEELWNTFSMIQYSEPSLIPEKDYQLAKHGYKIPLDVRRYIRYEIYGETFMKVNLKSFEVFIGNSRFTYAEFMDEIDLRKSIMRKWMEEYYDSRETTEPRT